MFAETSSRRPSELSSTAREALYATGHSLLGQDRLPEAAALFRILLRLAPTDERAWLALGECHEGAGHRAVALELYTAGVAAASNPARCALARFRILFDDGRTDEADAAFEIAREIADRSDDDALLELCTRERKSRS